MSRFVALALPTLRIEIARALLDDVNSPQLKIILDAANLLSPATLNQQHKIMSEAFDLLGNYLVLAHAKDIDAAGHVVAPGQGGVDLSAFVRGLKSVGFVGAVVGHGFEEKESAAAAETIRQLIAEA